MLFGKKKEKDEKKAEPIMIEFRISGIGLLQLIAIATLFVMLIAWISFILTSLLFFLSFSSVLIILVYGHEAMQKKGYHLGKKTFLAIAGAMFFLAMSLSPSNLVFVISAYGCGFFSPLLSYYFLRREIDEHVELQEVFDYE